MAEMARSDDSEACLEPEEGWVELPMSLWQSHAPSFVSGDPSGDRLRVRYYRRSADGGLVGKAWFGPKTQGPPGHGHGGSMAALLDEVMGAAAWLGGYPALAANLTVDFKRMIPLGEVARIEARILEVSGRKVITNGQLTDAAGAPYALARGLFISMADRAPSGVFNSWKSKAREELHDPALADNKALRALAKD